MAKVSSKEEIWYALVQFLNALTSLVTDAKELMAEEKSRKRSREHI